MESSRTKSSMINVSVEVLMYIFTLLFNFISRTVFIRMLSSEYLGLNGLFSNVLTVLSLTELGIGDAMVFAMYKPMKEKNYAKLNALIQLYRKAFLVIALIVACIGIALSFYLEIIIKELPNISDNLQVIFMMFIINNVCSYFTAHKKSLLLVDQKNYISSIAKFVCGMFQSLLQIIILVLTQNYYLFLLAQLSCTILNNILLSGIVKMFYPFINKCKGSRLPKEEVSEIIKSIKALSISKIAGVVSNGSDNIVIARILGLQFVGVASNYTLLINAVSGMLWSAVNGISGSIGNLNVDSSVTRRCRVFDELFLFTYWIYAFACICILVLINPFVELWLGKEYLISQTVVFMLVQIIYVSGINFPLFTYRTTMGYFDQVKWFFVASAVLNVVLSVILGLYWGLAGVYAATSLSRLCTSEIADGYYTYKYCLNRSVWKYWVKYIVFYAIYIITLFVTSFVINLIRVDGFIGFLLKAVTCLCVSNTLLFMMLSTTRAFKDLYKRISGVLYTRLSKNKNDRSI